jgi:hypothetical protein
VRQPRLYPVVEQARPATPYIKPEGIANRRNTEGAIINDIDPIDPEGAIINDTDPIDLVFSRIDDLGLKELYIGGDHEAAMPESVFNDLIANFPNTHELRRYVLARINSTGTVTDWDSLKPFKIRWLFQMTALSK